MKKISFLLPLLALPFFLTSTKVTAEKIEIENRDNSIFTEEKQNSAEKFISSTNKKFISSISSKNMYVKTNVQLKAGSGLSSPPTIKNHKFKQNNDWYYGKLYLQSYQLSNGNYEAIYSGILYAG